MKFFNTIKNKFSSKASRTASVIMSSGGSGVIWAPRNYDNFAKEAYLKNIISFRCIDLISKSVSSVPWKLYKVQKNGEKKEDTKHPINELLKRPNPQESWNFLILKTIAYLAMSGNTFLERVAPQTGPNKGIPKELHCLRPSYIKIVANPSTGRLVRYEFDTGNGNAVIFKVDQITEQSDILQMKFFHPTEDWWGAAITESAAREIDTSNEATTWNKKLLENEARPGMIFTYAGQLTDSQFDRLERQLLSNHTGSENAGKNLIVEGTGDSGKSTVTPYGFSPQEMDFIEGGRELARKISYAYGVPPQLIGIPGDSTYSNYKEARLAFWEDTVFFYLNLLKGELNNWLFTDEESLELCYVLDDIPALQMKRDMLWERANTASFLTENEKRAIVNYDPIEGGDVLLVPANMLPLAGEDIDDFPTEEPEEEPKPIPDDVDEEIEDENSGDE